MDEEAISQEMPAALEAGRSKEMGSPDSTLKHPDRMQHDLPLNFTLLSSRH